MPNYFYDEKTRKYTFSFYDLLVYVKGNEIKRGPFRHRHNAEKYAKELYGRTVEWHVLGGTCTSSYPPSYID